MGRAQDERHEQRTAARRRPRAALAAAAGGLLGGGDERAVRRAREGELARAVVGGRRRPQVEPWSPERAHTGLMWTSSSSARPRTCAAEPRFTASASVR